VALSGDVGVKWVDLSRSKGKTRNFHFFIPDGVILDSPGPEQRFQHVPPAGLSSLPQAVFERLWLAGLIENNSQHGIYR